VRGLEVEVLRLLVRIASGMTGFDSLLGKKRNGGGVKKKKGKADGGVPLFRG
jgi:hypothetical protein